VVIRTAAHRVGTAGSLGLPRALRRRLTPLITWVRVERVTCGRMAMVVGTAGSLGLPRALRRRNPTHNLGSSGTRDLWSDGYGGWDSHLSYRDLDRGYSVYDYDYGYKTNLAYDTYDYDYGYNYDKLFGGTLGGTHHVDYRVLKRIFRNRTRILQEAIQDTASKSMANTTSWPLWRIPSVLHQTWKSDAVPSKYSSHISSWRRLHRHWKFEFWDDSRIRRLMTENFPHYSKEFDRMSGIKRADVARIAILFVIGGVYADIDVEAARSFDGLLEAAQDIGAGVLLGEENFVHTVLLEQKSSWLVSNAVMASSRGHPFWLQALEEIFRNTWCGEDPVQCTGPRLVDRLSWEYIRRHPSCPRTTASHGCLVRLPFVYFSPNIARWNAGNMARECTGHREAFSTYSYRSRKPSRIRRACKSLEMTLSYPAVFQSKHTFAIHHWQCSWCRKDASLESVMPIHAIIWSVGNESVN